MAGCIIGYGGSESLQSPKRALQHGRQGPAARARRRRRALRDRVRARASIPRSACRAACSSRARAFGRDVLVAGDASSRSADDDDAPAMRNARPIAEFVADFPISDAEQGAAHRALRRQARSARRQDRRGEAHDPQAHELSRLSDQDLRLQRGGGELLPGPHARLLRARLRRGAGRRRARPRLSGLCRARPAGRHNPAWNEPYIYHFPDGNASLARLLVRALIPGVAPGNTMDDVVLAPFDYGKLDRRDSSVRIRLDSTCVNVRRRGGKVQIAYVRDGTLHRVAGAPRRARLLPHDDPVHHAGTAAAAARGAGAERQDAARLHQRAGAQLAAWVKLGVHDITAPMSFHRRVKLDFPVSLGGYRHPRDPAEPIVLHLVHVPGAPNQGLDARTQFRIGRAQAAGDDVRRFRGAHPRRARPHARAGRIFQRARHRRDHGQPLVARLRLCRQFAVRSRRTTTRPCSKRARQPFGRVAIANTDAGGDAYAHLAIDQAARAVRELVS